MSTRKTSVNAITMNASARLKAVSITAAINAANWIAQSGLRPSANANMKSAATLDK